MVTHLMRGGIVASSLLVSGLSSLGLSPGQGHSVVVLGKTLNQDGTGKLLGKPKKIAGE